MAFKLGGEKRGIKSSENVSIVRKPIEGTAEARANNDGTIDVDPSININSKKGARIVAHEMKHMEQMAEGRNDYGDGWMMWENKIYFRGEEEGIKYIDGPNGRWPEGHPNHPWEAEAIEAEKLIN